MNKRSLNKLRDELLADIRTKLPSEQEYVDFYLSYCAGIKYLDESGAISTYRPYNGQLEPTYIDQLPLDSLVELLEELDKRIIRQGR